MLQLVFFSLFSLNQSFHLNDKTFFLTLRKYCFKTVCTLITSSYFQNAFLFGGVRVTHHYIFSSSTSSIFHHPCVPRMLSRLSFKILFVYTIFAVNSIFFCFPLITSQYFVKINSSVSIRFSRFSFTILSSFCDIVSVQLILEFITSFPRRDRYFISNKYPAFLWLFPSA